jgi:spore coat polysaccharide biosynthesis protein SpsF
MKFLTTIEARFDSTRLPGKVIYHLSAKKTVLDILIHRIKKSQNVNKIILATSKKKSNYKIIKVAKKNKIFFYKGSENNVLERLVKATHKYNEKYIIQLTADNPLIDYRIIDYMVSFFKKNYKKYDFVTNNNLFNKKKLFIPNGMIVSIFKKNKLVESLAYQKKNKEKDLAEHPTLYFYRNGIKKVRSINLQMPKKWTILPNARLTLDTKEDYILINKIYNKLKNIKNFSLVQILKYLKNNPELLKINQNIIQKNPKKL